jgi:hypothetical protein
MYMKRMTYTIHIQIDVPTHIVTVIMHRSCRIRFKYYIHHRRIHIWACSVQHMHVYMLRRAAKDGNVYGLRFPQRPARRSEGGFDNIYTPPPTAMNERCPCA